MHRRQSRFGSELPRRCAALLAFCVALGLAAPAEGVEHADYLRNFAQQFFESKYRAPEGGDLGELTVEHSGAGYSRFRFASRGLPYGVDLFAADLQGDSRREYLLVVAPIPPESWSKHLFFFAAEPSKEPPSFLEREGPAPLKLVDRAEVGDKYGDFSVGLRHITSPDHWDVWVTRAPPSTYRRRKVTVFHLHDDTVTDVFSVETLFYDWKHRGTGDSKVFEDSDLPIGDDQAYRETQTPLVGAPDADGPPAIEVAVREEVVRRVDDKSVESKPVDQVLSTETKRYEWDEDEQTYREVGAPEE